ncbi:MAG: hypothetical protein Q8N53_07725, partial [Longimicrobiales bacterium]|nr:hypothetical protein [Longimicrobiales bacterium]
MALFATLALLLPMGATAQNATWNAQEILAAKEWVAPPVNIADAVLAPRWLNVALSERSADGNWFLTEVGDGPVTMDRFSKPFDDLGGMFLDFRANRSRTLTIRSGVGLEAISAVDGRKVTVQVPQGARVSNGTWSPNGAQVAFFVHTDDATHIYVAAAADGRSRQVTRTPVLATAVTALQWTADGAKIATVLPPDGRAARPLPPAVPTGPQVKHTEDGENMLRNYASLMKTPYDEQLLEWHVTGQLALIGVSNRQVEKVGSPTMIWAFDFSKDGEYVRVTKLKKPFSYVVPVSNFGRADEIWDRTGKKLVDFDTTAMNTGIEGNVPDAPGVGGAGNEQGKRQVAWRRDNKGLTYLEQEPAPDTASEAGRAAAAAAAADTTQNARARRKDKVMHWAPPFDSASLKVLYENNNRMSAHRYSPDHGWLFLSERQGQNIHEFGVQLSNARTKHTLARYGAEDFYANAGSLVLSGGSVPGGGGGGGGGGGARGGGETVQLSADGA